MRTVFRNYCANISKIECSAFFGGHEKLSLMKILNDNGPKTDLKVSINLQ